MSSVTINDAAIDAMARDPAGPIAEIMEQEAYKVESLAKILVMTPGSGRYYAPGVMTFMRHGKIYSNFSTGGRASGHRASAPGEPPSSDTGLLMNSIGHTITVEDTVIARVTAGTKYAIWLELGTRYMDPRPFLRPALAAVAGP